MIRPRRPLARRVSAFTLIELTLVLAVIVTLALILTPSIANFINDSRVARARNDCATLASAVVQFYKDTGFFPEWSASGNGGPGYAASRLDLLATAGNAPVVAARVAAVAGGRGWTSVRTANIADQLMVNAPRYALRGPGAQFGWNGPYLSSAPGSDPWNNRYLVNIGLVDVGQEGDVPGVATKSAVWVLSAGPNGIIETLHTQPVTGAVLGGDDIGIRIQ